MIDQITEAEKETGFAIKLPKSVGSFKLLQEGVSCDFDYRPDRKEVLPTINTNQLGAPPVYNDDLLQVVEETFFANTNDLSINNFVPAQKTWERDINSKSLFRLQTSANGHDFKMKRDNKTGAVIGFVETATNEDLKDSKNSSSLTRAPGSARNFVKGTTEQLPFLPGGMEQVNKRIEATDKLINESALEEELNFEKDLLHVAPGLGVGLLFDENGKVKDEPAPDFNRKSKSKKIIAINNLLENDDFEFLLSQSEDELEDDKENQNDNNNNDNNNNNNNNNNNDNNNNNNNMIIDNKTQVSNNTEDNNNDDSFEDLKAVLKVDVKTKKPKEERELYAEVIDIKRQVTNFHTRVKDMAKQYPFELDTFQKQAVLCLENHDSVFVAAHTSAGKTVVAEYAIALCQRHMTRAIYTSPIKSLSNQKFRDFKETFEDVGLLTGDVQINPEASCLIMTTEILRSMLYRGADLIRDVEWVIFDEVHYVNDIERGVVWEEVIIMLPEHVNIILLSATVPNTFEFAEWIGRTKKKKVYVINTLQRPVPLEHYLYTGPVQPAKTEVNRKFDIDQSLHKMLNAKKEVLNHGYEGAKVAIAPPEKKQAKFGPKTGKSVSNAQSDKNLYTHLVGVLVKKKLVPTVVFTFSKKRCEGNAKAISNQDLTNSSEKSSIRLFFNKATSKLKGEDRNLPQVKRMEMLLTKGIGVHHGGLLPILKEVVEILFCEGLVKVLYATETFAMGVNMPAKSVVFDSTRKHDGNSFRDLLPGEYVQMAGRAGRRGLDTTGTVILMCKNSEVPDKTSLTTMMIGQPTKLESQFRLTYNMIINLLRVEAFKVEDMMKRSFSEYSTQKHAGEHEKEIKQSQRILSKLENIDCINCIDIESYYKACCGIISLNFDIQKTLFSHPSASKLLSPGRVIVLKHRNTLCCVLSFTTVKMVPKLTCLVLNFLNATESTLPINALGVPGNNNNKPEISKIESSDVLMITKSKIKIDADIILKGRKNEEEIEDAVQALIKLGTANLKGLETVNLIKELRITDFHANENFHRYVELLESLTTHSCYSCPELNQHYAEIYQKKSLEEKMISLRYNLSDQNLTLLPEYHQRVNVLQLMNYIDEDSIVQLKGRVACEVNTCDEVIVTELIFNSVFSDMQPEQVVALLSCMVCQERNASSPNLTPPLEAGKEKILAIAGQIADTQLDCGLDIPKDEYLQSLNFALTEVVFEWARGMPFSEITNLTDVQEGSIVRCIVRLDEACRDVRNAARVIGDPALYDKLEEASNMIKRDIVFAASLYINS